MKNYTLEAEQRFGDTNAYKEYAHNTSGYTDEKWQEVTDGLNAILAEFAECKASGNTADSDKAKLLVKKLQTYITDNYYTCTKEILAGLGEMYVADERFKGNIDKHGQGTAEFICQAIKHY